MKILLLGGNGQVGWELQRSLAPLGELVVLGRAGQLAADLSAPERLRDAVRIVAPDAIVNAAAYTAVDRAESEPELAHTVNGVAPGVLGDAAAATGALLIHYSTDYVFDGGGHEPWSEDAPTAPLNTYGRTKLEGEQRIRASGAAHLILRTSWVYAARGSNFGKTMLRLAQSRETLSVVDDQFGAPTGADLLADVTAHLLRTVGRERTLGGTYHLAAAGTTTWHAYAEYLIGLARHAGAQLTVQEQGVRPVPSTSFPTPARRPSNSRLSTRKLEASFGLVMPPWQRGVERLVAELLQP